MVADPSRLSLSITMISWGRCVSSSTERMQSRSRARTFQLTITIETSGEDDGG